MAIGTTRREGVQNNLAGQAEMQPITLQGPGIQNARAIRPPDTSVQAQITQQLSKWGSQKLAVAANTKNEKDFLEGQMAYQQDKALEDVDMAGNKWALEGHMFMDAQTISSSLFEAQREDIKLNSHTMSPEDFRARQVNRLDQMIADKDPRTAELVREQMLKNLPTLIADHTVQNMRYKEGQNYDALERSIDVISRDPTATDQLISFAAGGAGSASEGLSDERRQAAVVSGVVRAYANDNPLAHAALAGAGMLGDDMSAADTNAIRGAKAAFETRARSSYDATLFNGQQALMAQVENAEIGPMEAVEQLSILYADHDISMNMADAGAIFGEAQTNERMHNQTQANLYEDAANRGDWAATARITEGLMVDAESGGNQSATGPVIQSGANAGDQAQGSHQVMPKTLRDPGFGIRPSNGTPEDDRRVGSEYWAAMHVEFEGDLEAVAIAYNAGPANAKKWIAAGRDDSVLPKASETRPYADKIMAAGRAWSKTTPEQRLAISEKRMQATYDRMAMDTYQRIAPALTDADNKFTRGEMTQDDWQEERNNQYAQYNVAKTKADIDHEISTATSVENAVIARREALVERATGEDEQIRLEGAQSNLIADRATYEAVVNDETSTPDQVAQATAALQQARKDTFDEWGIAVTERGNSAANEAMYKDFLSSVQRRRGVEEDNTLIAHAENASTVGTLPTNLQERAVAEQQAKASKQVQDLAAANPGVPASTLGAIERGMVTDYIAENGIVDPNLQQVVNLAASGQAWLDRDGKPNPSTVAGLHAFTTLLSKNAGLAFQYVPDPEARGRMMAAAFMVQTQFPNSDVFNDVDLTDRNDPITDAFHTAVQQVGLAIDRPATPEQQTARVNSALRSMESGNISNTVFGGFGKGDPATALIPNNMLAAGLSSRFDVADVNAARSIDNASVNAGFEREVVNFLEEVMPHMPATSTSAATTMALDYVTSRGAVLGSTFVMPTPDKPSIRAQMFPGEQVSNTAAPNTAIAEWMNNPEVQASNPVIAEWYEANAPLAEAGRALNPLQSRNPGTQEAPQYTVHLLNGTYRAMLPGFGSVPLPMREIGDLYKSTR